MVAQRVGPDDKVSVFLEDWELARVVPGRA